ncbi:MBL fold metallo-hydrolase RNA specificity domain-containing protein [Nocardioides ferulae]|uniref:MBL fold metallo-hydrolase RNA specificity domain-containing protein n=1 Tax=Nocardioides ferulae TaxID=2340821 RepID=UPI000EB0A8FE|nr:MBL fold metallo-hydrolase [Nocardioides ferulae]
MTEQSRTDRAPLSLTFLGAAGTVTGSKFLLESRGHRVLVDCGLFQGDRVWRRRNWEELTVDPRTVDAVVLTHAHLDHCGYLPRLVREGFQGPVVCTPNTALLAGLVLRDAAHLQERDAEYAARSGTSRHQPPLPLFDTRDAERALALIETLPWLQPRELPGGLTLTLHRGGHILGSSWVELGYDGLRIAFSGDLGRPDHPLLLPPEELGAVDVVVVESTYGDRSHQREGDHDLAVALRRTLGRGGIALLPAFAVDRTAMLLHRIQRLIAAGEVPDVPVHVDSPMALDALAIYRRALTDPASEMRPALREAGNPFDPGRLRLVRSPYESQTLNEARGPAILISASGMASGGRVLHHLEHQLPERRNAVIMTGFQVPGTRGRQLLDGARQVKIHGRYIPVRAEVVDVGGFSAHADAGQLVDWLSTSPPPTVAYVVHGEPDASTALADRLGQQLGWNAVVPRYLERVRLD